MGAQYCEKIDDLLRESDFVMLAVNLSPQTHKLIGKRELNLMKPTGTLVNISRGLSAHRATPAWMINRKIYFLPFIVLCLLKLFGDVI